MRYRFPLRNPSTASRRLRAIWSIHSPSGWRQIPDDLDPSTPDVDDEEHVRPHQTSEAYHFDREKVRRGDGIEVRPD